MKGRLIVIEGVDGSGKTTQAELLVQHFEHTNTPVMLVDFPQYEGFYGKIVAKYLRGEFGSIAQTSPFLIAIIYALDRSTVRDKMTAFLEEGGTIVANRYVPSNVAHQAANIGDPVKQKEFIRWIQELEYKELKLPKEDTVIYLYLPWDIGMKKSEEKLNSDRHHDYLQGELDIHEKSIAHRKATEALFLTLLGENNHWHRIDCVDENGKQLTPDEVNKKILDILRSHV